MSRQGNTSNGAPTETVKDRILNLIRDSPCGLSHREIMGKTGLGNRIVKRCVDELCNDQYSNIKIKDFGPSLKLVYYNFALPSGDKRKEVVELARRNEYPIYMIVAKIFEVDPNAFVLTERGRDRTLSSMAEAIQNTNREIYWWAGDFSSFWRVKDLLLDRLNKKMRLKILMNIGPVSYENARQIVKMQKEFPEQIELRHWESEWRGTIHDGERLRLIWKMRRDAHEVKSNGRVGDDQRYIYVPWETTRRDWVNLFHDVIWNDHWKMASMNPKPETILNTVEQSRYNV